MDTVPPARATMGPSRGFHIVFAVLGVGMPLLMSAAEGLSLWRHDEAWMVLARRWSKAFGILFAVGAVSGTVLSFELGLLWPRFMAFSGGIFGLPFSAEGFAFFLEAIFLGPYLYGWERLSPLKHWLTSIPIALSGAASAVFVVMANAWMNTPAAFRLRNRQLVSVDPLGAALNPSTPTEDPHMLVSAYVVTGFLVAAVYAAGLLRGRNDVFHRRGLAAGMAMAAIAIVLAGVTGDSSARFVYGAQPAKFAAMEGLYRTQRGAPITIGGIPSDSQQRGLYGIQIPKGFSFLAAFCSRWRHASGRGGPNDRRGRAGGGRPLAVAHRLRGARWSRLRRRSLGPLRKRPARDRPARRRRRGHGPGVGSQPRLVDLHDRGSLHRVSGDFRSAGARPVLSVLDRAVRHRVPRPVVPFSGAR